MVKVTLLKDGKEISENRKVLISANKVTTVDLSDLGSPDKKLRTWQYWAEAKKKIHEEWSPNKDAKTAAFLNAAQTIATEIGDLPTLGVDEDAVTVIQDEAEVLSKIVKISRASQSPDRMFEAFVRGYNGDPFGVAKEINAERIAIGERFEALLSKSKKTRALLTSRYNVEFPSISMNRGVGFG